MTREEARVLLDNEYHVDMNEYRSADEFLDIIYDDFESRTCENCKWYSPSKNIENYGVCTNDDIGCLYGANPSFGCNKFERKTDGNV